MRHVAVRAGRTLDFRSMDSDTNRRQDFGMVSYAADLAFFPEEVPQLQRMPTPRKRSQHLRDSFFIVVAEVAGDGDTTRDSRLRLGRATTDARLARGLQPDDMTGWECRRLRAALGFVALLGRWPREGVRAPRLAAAVLLSAESLDMVSE